MQACGGSVSKKIDFSTMQILLSLGLELQNNHNCGVWGIK